MYLPFYVHTYMCTVTVYVYTYIYIYIHFLSTQHALLKVHGAATIIANNLPRIHPKQCSERKTSSKISVLNTVTNKRVVPLHFLIFFDMNPFSKTPWKKNMFVYELSNLMPSGQRHADNSGSVKNCMCGNAPAL